MRDKDITEYIEDTISTLDFTPYKDKINKVDKALSILMDNMDYKEYTKFIKSNKKLCEYDTLLGSSEINILGINHDMINNIPDHFFEDVLEIVIDKINEVCNKKDNQ